MNQWLSRKGPVLLLLLLGPAFLSVSSAQQAKIEVKTPAAVKTPLPGTVTIWPPDSSLPREASAFSGIWVGKFENLRDATLVVQRISPADGKGVHKVDLIYSWGVSRSGSYRFQKADYREYDGKLKAGELEVQYGRLNMRWMLQPDGTLAHEWQVPDLAATYKAVFTKVSE